MNVVTNQAALSSFLGPVISAVAGLAGVIIGGLISVWKDRQENSRKERLHILRLARILEGKVIALSLIVKGRRREGSFAEILQDNHIRGLLKIKDFEEISLLIPEIYQSALDDIILHKKRLLATAYVLGATSQWSDAQQWLAGYGLLCAQKARFLRRDLKIPIPSELDSYETDLTDIAFNGEN